MLIRYNAFCCVIFMWRYMSKHYQCNTLASNQSFSRFLLNKKTVSLDLKHKQKNLSCMTEDASEPQKLLLFKTTGCAASAYLQAKESHQHVMEEESFIESRKTENRCATELSVSTKNEGDKSCVALIYCPCCSV